MKKRLKATIAFLPGGQIWNRFGRAPVDPTELATPLDAFYGQADIVFKVPVDKCHYTYHFSYAFDGWHPFVRTLRQYIEGRASTYDTSILCKYYQAFQPRTFVDVFFENGDDDPVLQSSRLREWAIGTHYPCLPWDPALQRIRGEGGLSMSDGLQGFGPVSDQKGRWEFSRLISTYHSIRRRGYRPTRDSDGEIRGYFLKMGSDYRFLIRAGFHRAAVLSALRHDAIRVKFKANFPRAIDLADIDNWPLVKRELVERDVAEKIFTRFFTDDGTRKAKNLGLLQEE